MDEQEFKREADKTLTSLFRRLSAAGDDAEFEADFTAGALTIEFEKSPAKFVISPNAPVRQIWVSAHSKSFKLDWDPDLGTFVLPDTRKTLAELIQQSISQELGEPVAF